jgi:hypothetical protein
MKAKTRGVITLALITLGSIGCSSSPTVYYAGNKAYAKNPETGKIMSWKYKSSGRDEFEHFGSKPIFDIRPRADGLSPEVSLSLN